MKSQKILWHVGIDVGGTFTDFVVVPDDGASDPSRAITHKVASTPQDPSEAVREGLQDLTNGPLKAEDISRLTHGTTIGLNAVLQGRGAKVSLLTSKGHRDVMQIARARLPRSFDLHAAPPIPVVKREDAYEIDFRFTPEGDPVAPLDENNYREVVAKLAASGAESIAVSLMGGYAAELDELLLCDRLAEDLGVTVTSAANVWPEAREFERGTLAVLDAQIKPLMTQYLNSLESKIRGLNIEAPLFVSASNGGSVSLEAARQRPIQTILSGPAAGVSAAALQFPGLNMVTFDMGGTSSDIGVLVDGRPALTTASEVGEYPVVMPAVDVSAIGAGGGSVISADTAGSEPVLRVGPGSVGAKPGPACYGWGGTEPALTDAYVGAGIINPEAFLGGTFTLDRQRSVQALSRVHSKLGQTANSEIDAAHQVLDDALRAATAGMAAKLRTVLAKHGQVPQKFAFVAFGGAGPTHAAILADEVGIQHVIVPSTAATFCALGAALTPVRRDFVKTVERVLEDSAATDLNLTATEVARDAVEWLKSQGETEGFLTIAADIRYEGQPTTLSVNLSTKRLGLADVAVDEFSGETLIGAFEETHQRYYGFVDAKATIQIRNLRITVAGPDPVLMKSGTETRFVIGEARKIFIGGMLKNATTAKLGDLTGSNTEAVQLLEGPAVIDKQDTTVLVPEGWQARLDDSGSIHLVTGSAATSIQIEKGN